MKDFYDGKCVLVTGHTGFKGAWLYHWLESMGALVFGMSLYPFTKPNLYDAIRDYDEEWMPVVDISNYQAVRKAIDDVKPEIVFHLAAEAIVKRAYQNPRKTVQDNVMGTTNILHAIYQTLPIVKSVVVITTDKVYKEGDQIHSENDPLGGVEIYSASKAAVELICDAYREAYLLPNGVGIATARAGNCIGGGDWAPFRIVPDLVRAMNAGEQLIIKNPDAVRPWMYVLDVLYGYLLLGMRLNKNHLEYSEAWNFGPDEVVSVGDLVGEFSNSKQLLTSVNKKLTVLVNTNVDKDSKQKGPHETALLYLSNVKAKERLGWCCRVGFSKMVSKTARWYRRFNEGKKARQLCSVEIKEYEDEAE